MTPKPKQAVAEGIRGVGFNPDTGGFEAIVIGDKKYTARQIAHALNSLPGVVKMAKLAVDAIWNSPTEPSSIVLQAANDLDAALTAAEKGMV